MDLLTYLDHHWFTGFFVATGIVMGASALLQWPFRIVKRVIRSIDIRSQGWPPAHVDADGDFKPEPKKEASK